VGIGARIPRPVQRARAGHFEGNALMLRCRDVVELLVEYLDDQLDPATAGALAAHVTGCEECTAFTNTYRKTVQALRQLREEDLPSQLRDRLRGFPNRQTDSGRV